jgi:hypothetical protein
LTKHEFPKKNILLKTGQTEKYLSLLRKALFAFIFPRKEMTWHSVLHVDYPKGSFDGNGPGLSLVPGTFAVIVYRLDLYQFD